MMVNTTPDFSVSPTASPLASCCGSRSGDALSEVEAHEAAAALKALADPIRLRLVSILATSPDGEVCACDLPAWLDRSQPTVSHHLSILVDAGVLAREQRGKWAWFRLRTDRLAELSAVLLPADHRAEVPIPSSTDTPIARQS